MTIRWSVLCCLRCFQHSSWFCLAFLKRHINGPWTWLSRNPQKYVGGNRTRRKYVFCTFCLDFIHFGLLWLFTLYIHYLFVHLIWKHLNVFANLLATAPLLSLYFRKKKIRQSRVAASEVRGQWGAVASAHQKRATWCQNCSPPLPPLPPSMADCKPVNTEEGGVRCVWVCEGVYGGGVVGAGLNV